MCGGGGGMTGTMGMGVGPPNMHTVCGPAGNLHQAALLQTAATAATLIQPLLLHSPPTHPPESEPTMEQIATYTRMLLVCTSGLTRKIRCSVVPSAAATYSRNPVRVRGRREAEVVGEGAAAALLCQGKQPGRQAGGSSAATTLAHTTHS